MPLHYVEGEPPAQGAPLLVLLHGYGSDEEDLMGLAPALDPRFHVVSARAPMRLAEGGFAWFPLAMTEGGLEVSFQEAEAARGEMCELLAGLQQQYDASGRTLLLGFSQGAGMALYSGFRIPETIAGIAFLSGLCLPEMVPEGAASNSLNDMPVFMSHGRSDPLIPIARGRESRDMLADLPLRIIFNEYAMGHEINAECLRDLQEWLRHRADDLVRPVE